VCKSGVGSGASDESSSVQAAVNIIKLCQCGKLKPESTEFLIYNNSVFTYFSTFNGVSFSRVRARLMCSFYGCNIYAVLSSRQT
jgi:hypothetical protein